MTLKDLEELVVASELAAYGGGASKMMSRTFRLVRKLLKDELRQKWFKNFHQQQIFSYRKFSHFEFSVNLNIK